MAKALDGGFSTQLAKYVGLMDGDPLWTARFVAKNPDAVLRSHLDYLEAGADFIETCTYQASVDAYCEHLKLNEEQALALIKSAGDIALEAKRRYMENNPNAIVEVVGSLGPYGALLNDGSEYTGSYTDRVTVENMKETHRPRIRELMKAGIEIFAFETIPSKKEGMAAAELLEEFPSIKAWISFTCKDEKSTSFGDDFKDAAVCCYRKNPKQLLGVGVNCSNPLYIHNLFEGINAVSEADAPGFIPLVVYPNSGEAYTKESGWKGQVDIPPLQMFVSDWISLGVRYIGGCCRVASDQISLIKKEILKLNALKK